MAYDFVFTGAGSTSALSALAVQRRRPEGALLFADDRDLLEDTLLLGLS